MYYADDQVDMQEMRVYRLNRNVTRGGATLRSEPPGIGAGLILL